jgi:hypothetical protein
METKIGTMQVPAAICWPNMSATVALWETEDGQVIACLTPAEMGLPPGWPTVERPDMKGGVYGAALFTAKQCQQRQFVPQ